MSVKAMICIPLLYILILLYQKVWIVTHPLEVGDSIQWSNRFEPIRGTESKLAEFLFRLCQCRLLPSCIFCKLLQNNSKYASLSQDKSSPTPKALLLKYQSLCDYCFCHIRCFTWCFTKHVFQSSMGGRIEFFFAESPSSNIC